jgi:hypothetical protein
MPIRCKPSEVLAPTPYVLVECTFGINEAARPENTLDLSYTAIRIRDRWQDSLNDDGVEAAVREWQVVRVTD